MARSASPYEPVAAPAEAVDPLTRARRRFLGALLLFLATAVTLPFVMDSEPPAPLRAPTVEVLDEQNRVLVRREPEKPVIAEVSPAGQPAPAEPVEAPQEPSAAPSAPVPPHPLASAKPPTGGHLPEQRTVSLLAEKAEREKPLAPPDKGKAPPSALPDATHAAPASPTPNSAASAGSPTTWNSTAIQERARAEAALRGLAGASQPLAQFWYVQAGAFKEREAAEGVVRKLRGSGLPAYLVAPSAPSDGGWYRVRVAPYVTEAEAKAAAAQVAKVAGGQPSVAAARVSR